MLSHVCNDVGVLLNGFFVLIIGFLHCFMAFLNDGLGGVLVVP